MNIGEVISKPFQIIWKHKILWALGAIGGVLGAAMSAFWLWLFMANRSLLSTTGETFRLPPDFMSSPLYRWIRSLDQNQIPVSLLVTGGVILGVFLLSWLASIFTQSCIICGTRMADEGSADIQFETILKQGWKPFGKVVLFSLLVYILLLAIYSVIALVLIPVLVNSNEDAILLMVLTLCCSALCVILPLWFFISIFFRLITVAIAHDNTRVFTGIKKAWQTFRKAFGMFLLFQLILIGMTMAANIVPSLINGAVQSGTTIAGAFGGNNTGSTSTTSIIIAALAGLVSWIFSSFILTYTMSAWTLAYRRVAYPPAIETSPLPAITP
jgi:hypothetical protein